jgi:hypothetical protein
MRFIAKKEIIEDNIHYLGLEYDEEALGNGVLLLHLLDSSFDSCQHDDWFISIEIAKQVAFEQYGIREGLWEEYEKEN